MSAYDITTAGARLTFEPTNNGQNAMVKIDDTHFLAAWTSTTTYKIEAFAVNTTTWAITTAAASFSNGAGTYKSLLLMDANHALSFWCGVSDDGFAQIYTVNTTTWAVTTAAAMLEFDTQDNSWNTSFKIDTTHAINFWKSASSQAKAQVFAINTTTWVVTTAAAALVFDTQDNDYNACYQVDTNHFINFWSGLDHDGYVQVFTVNTTTWVISTTAAPLEFDTQNNQYNSCYKMDTNHFVNFWSGLDSDGYAQVFEVNTTTFAVTTAGPVIEFDVSNNAYNSVSKIDLNHFVNMYRGGSNDGFAEVFSINTSTWVITTASVRLDFETEQAGSIASFRMDTNHFIGAWAGDFFGTDGRVQAMNVEIPLTIITEAITGILTTLAVGHGEIIFDGGETITERGLVWATVPDPTTANGKVIVAGGPVGAYSGNLTSLLPNTLYYVRAYCISGLGTTYGENATFTTTEIVINTNPATDIQTDTAVGHGNIVSDGDETITQKGIVWGLTINPTTAGSKVIVAGATEGEFEGDMTGLTPGEFYYFRAYMITASGTYYGANETFTTQAANARVGTLDTGFTDFDEPIYFDMIDRWRSYTLMYAKAKSISGLNVYSENAAGARVLFQKQKDVVNKWEDLGTVTEANNSLLPNANTEDFDVGRLRITGFTSGSQIVVHAIEILTLQDKGFEEN